MATMKRGTYRTKAEVDEMAYREQLKESGGTIHQAKGKAREGEDDDGYDVNETES